MQQQASTEAARTNRAPIPMECDAPFLKVVGELPRELNGTLYRNGPNPQFDCQARTGSSATACCTPFISRTAAPATATAGSAPRNGRPSTMPAARCSAGFGRRVAGCARDSRTDGGVANTNIIFHAGTPARAGGRRTCRPRSSPGTLQPRGYCDYDGAIAGPFTAHPKIDPVTGEMVFFGYNAAGPLTPALSFGSVNASGVVTRFDRFEAPYASMVHDFIVTENHLLFPILPLTGSMERAMGGQPPYAWEPDKGAYVGVMKRNGAAKDIVWFRAESCYVFHVMNAWEEGDRIIADVMQFEEAPLFTHPDGSPTDPKKSRARLLPLDLRSRRQYRPLHANLSRRPHRRISAHRRSPRRA